MSSQIKTAVAYARFSSNNQREESIDAQKRQIEEFARQNGYRIITFYTDHAKTATTDDRPGFQQMFSDIPKLKVDAVIIHKLDRFARDRYDSAIYKHQLKEYGTRLISVIENFDDSPESVILESVIEAMAEYYSKNLARETMKGLVENAYKCRHNGGKPPLGYDVDPVTHGYVINEQEAEIVRSIFDMYLNGKSYEEIVTHMNSCGCRTKSGNAYSRSSIHDILKNEKYIGVYSFNVRAAKGLNGKYNSRKHKDDEDIIRIEGGIPQIVDTEKFMRIKSLFAERKHKSGAFTAKHEYLLSGKVACGLCGSCYVGNYQKASERFPEYITYRCGRKNKSVKCDNKAIGCEKLERAVLKVLSDRIFSEDMFESIAAHYEDYALSHNKELNRVYNLRLTAQRSMDEQISNIVNVMASTGSSALAEKLESLEKDREVCRREIAEIELKLNEIGTDRAALRAAFEQAKEMLLNGTLDSRRNIIDNYIDSVIIYPDRIDVIVNVDGDYTITESIEQ